MSKAIRALIQRKKAIEGQLESAILDEMERVAKRKKLTRVAFLTFRNIYWRGTGNEVAVPELDKLEKLYCTVIHSGGLQALWTSEKGWN